MKNKRKNKGFTLIELIVVIAILAILAAVAVPNFMGLTQRARSATEVAAAAQYASAINIANSLSDSAVITEIPDAEGLAAFKTALSPYEPTTTYDDEDLLAKVLVRITFTDGNAFVTNEAAIS